MSSDSIQSSNLTALHTTKAIHLSFINTIFIKSSLIREKTDEVLAFLRSSINLIPTSTLPINLHKPVCPTARGPFLRSLSTRSLITILNTSVSSTSYNVSSNIEHSLAEDSQSSNRTSLQGAQYSPLSSSLSVCHSLLRVAVRTIHFSVLKS